VPPGVKLAGFPLTLHFPLVMEYSPIERSLACLLSFRKACHRWLIPLSRDDLRFGVLVPSGLSVSPRSASGLRRLAPAGIHAPAPSCARGQRYSNSHVKAMVFHVSDSGITRQSKIGMGIIGGRRHVTRLSTSSPGFTRYIRIRQCRHLRCRLAITDDLGAQRSSRFFETRASQLFRRQRRVAS
jgi:hypothetical protein